MRSAHPFFVFVFSPGGEAAPDVSFGSVSVQELADLGRFIGTRSEDVPGGMLTMVVGAVAGGLLEICLGEPPQDALVAAFRVIAGKVDHKIPPELIGSIITALSPAVNGISARTANRL